MSNIRARLIVFASIVVYGAGATAPASRQVATAASDSSIRLFQERVSEYTRVRRQIVEHLPADRVEAYPGADTRYRQLLAAAIRAARRNSRPGDILCPEMAGRIRQLVQTELAKRGLPDRQAMLSEVPHVPRVRLNDFYPDAAPLATIPPLLLLQLASLPSELQYRFLGNAVILLDVDTNLVVDFIPNALQNS